MKRTSYQFRVLAEQRKNWWSPLQTVTLTDCGESETVDMEWWRLTQGPRVGEEIQAVRSMNLKRVKGSVDYIQR